MRLKLWSLTLGNFAIGTGVLIVPGMLNELRAYLGCTPEQIGLLFSAFAIVICLTGPLLAGWTGAIDRRKLLVVTLLMYAALHVLAAFMPGYNSLLVVRMITAFGAAIFTPQSAATAGMLVPPDQRGKAIGSAMLGWSFAGVLGMPIGSYLGAHIGWRGTMVAEGVLSLACALWLWRQLPARLYAEPMDSAGWKALFGNFPLLLVVVVTALQATGQFVVYPYIVLVWKDFIAATPGTISLLFALTGAAGVVGNVLASQWMDRAGVVRIGMLCMGLIATAFVLWPLSRNSVPITAMLLVLWGLGLFAINSAQQTRLVSLAPQLASASVALNSSAIYFGQAFGALIGGKIVSLDGTAHLTMVATALLVGAMLASQIAANMNRRRIAARVAAG